MKNPVARTLLLTTLLNCCGCSEEPEKPPATVKQLDPTKPEAASIGTDLVLTQDGRACRHQPSQTTFRLPPAPEWKSSLPATLRGFSSVEMKQGDDVAVWVSWSKIETPLVQVVAAELKGFRERFKDRNVGLLEQVTAGNNVGWKVELKSNADGDQSQHGHVYWFSVTSPDDTLWKIKLLATFPRDHDTTAIDQLPSQFDWPEREYGPRPE